MRLGPRKGIHGVAAALSVAVWTGPVAAQDWFRHPFGELRAYHGDWLAVCAEEGRGACRAVFTAKDSGSDAVFDTRIALHHDTATGGWSVSVMDRGLPECCLQSVRILVDGVELSASDGDRPDWAPGGVTVANLAETIALRGAFVSDRLLPAMRAGGRIQIFYAPQDAGNGSIPVSLRGVTAATRAIQTHTATR